MFEFFSVSFWCLLSWFIFGGCGCFGGVFL